jgi:hypothetical protein
MAVFLRGLSIGALVGAAIAGSAIWERARRRKEPEAAGVEEARTEPSEPPRARAGRPGRIGPSDELPPDDVAVDR